MTTYTITSIKLTEEFTGTQAEAIARAIEINDEYQPIYGVQVECDGETVYDTEDGAVKHGGTWFADDAEYTADGDRVVRGDGSYAVVGEDAESIAESLANGEASDSAFEWIDE